MPLSKHLTRWIMASVAEHFDARRQGLTMFVEGQLRETKTLKDFIELRVDGPYLTELSNDYWEVFIEINILVQSAQDQINYHRIYASVGIVTAAFEHIIQIFRIGKELADDGTLVGCMKLKGDKDARERIQTNHFGQVEPETGIFQSSVEGHYVMELHE